MKSGWVYILKCNDDSYYTGSTNNIQRRFKEHQSGEGANHTKKRLPVELMYAEYFEKVSDAYYREKQIQGWGRAKKEALIEGNKDQLIDLAKAEWEKD